MKNKIKNKTWITAGLVAGLAWLIFKKKVPTVIPMPKSGVCPDGYHAVSDIEGVFCVPDKS